MNASILIPSLVALLGIALLSAMDASIKYAAESHPVLTVTAMRYIAGTLFAIPIVMIAARRWPTRNMFVSHAARGAVITVAAVSFFYALTVLPITEAIAIAFVAPLLVPPFAALILGERMRRANIIACIIGFGGMIVTIAGGPAPEQAPERLTGVAAVIISAVAYALSMVLMRQRAVRDGPIIVGFFAAMFPALYITPVAFFNAPFPPLSDWPLFLMIGSFGSGGMFLLSWAYARAEAQQLTVLEYSGLGWAALFGWWIFAEPLRLQIVIGAAIIAIACSYSVWSDTQRKVLPR